jgi:Tfp pilus assembly protein PilN
MPLINLIQEQRLVTKKAEQQVLVLFLSAATIGIVAFLGTAWLMFKTIGIHAEANEIQEKIEELKPIQEQVASLESEIGQLRPRISTLTQAREQTEQWMRILDHLSTNTPEAVTLAELSAMEQGTGEDKKVDLKLRGFGTTQDSVGAFLLRVQTSTDLADTNLGFTKVVNDAERERLEFEFKSQVVDLNLSKKAEKDGTSA